MSKIDYQPYVCPNPEYDTSRVELSIDCKTLQGAVRAKIGECLLVMLDGVYIARKVENEVHLERIHPLIQA